ncbi:DUF418 domain-containing protein [Algoriphagus jejuensis]|uniref:DUF418 domain-containing protein n=1 Tax=Algoriphagus jejuensis TaxID=419934 RepID=A0ABN1MWM4_9BACT
MEKTVNPELVPVQQADRILSLDVMRGFVLFGILLMNINGFGLGFGYNAPTVQGGDTGLNLYTWMMTNLFFEGTMRALFSLLFGVGMFIFLDRLVKKGAGIKAADVYFRRITWLLVFGLIHGYLLLWLGEILYDYALMGFLVYSFRSMAAKKLILVALLLFCIGTVWNYFDFAGQKKLVNQVAEANTLTASGKELSKELKAAREAWDDQVKERSAEATAEFNQGMRNGYFGAVAFLAPFNMEFDIEMPYRTDVWDVLSMMLFGIALFKLGFLSGDRPAAQYWLMVLIGYVIGIAINYYEMQTILEAKFSILSYKQADVSYYWGRFFVSIGHVGLIMLFCKAPFLDWMKNGLAAVGKMALTNYLMHSVICMVIFTGVGFGLIGKLERYELLYVVVGTWIFQLILSPLWLRYYYYGPMEWLWRNLSYRKVHAFRKSPPETL